MSFSVVSVVALTSTQHTPAPTAVGCALAKTRLTRIARSHGLPTERSYILLASWITITGMRGEHRGFGHVHKKGRTSRLR